MSNKKERNSSIELLRIIIMLMIICCHFATFGGFSFVNISIPKMWWNVIEMGGNLAVVVFVMISGYFLINNDSLKINVSKIFKLGGVIVFYAITLLGLSTLIYPEYITKNNIIYSFSPISNRLWWFASTYFILYLIHPFLNKLLLNLTKKQYQTYIVFGLLIFSIVPNITLGSNQLSNLIEFIMYYSIAGYIRLFGLFEDKNSKSWLIWFIVLSTIKYLLYLLPSLVNFNHDWIDAHFTYAYNRNSIFTIIQAICLFMTFNKLNIKYNPIINKIASTTFGVYLIHDSNLLRPIIWKDIFNVASYQNTALIIPYSIVVTIIIFICCSVIDLIRQIVFEKPYMKLVNKYSGKIESIYNKFVDYVCHFLD